jgi:hypothetical protein
LLACTVLNKRKRKNIMNPTKEYYEAFVASHSCTFLSLCGFIAIVIKAAQCYPVQVCDATVDAMKYFCRLPKKKPDETILIRL